MQIPITQVVPNPEQPRTIFDQAELEGLAQSIRENGLIQPIVVEEAGGGYILIDGERRWRAHQIAGLELIEAVLKPSSHQNGTERLTRALVANIQRSSMGFVDEAKAYQKLIEEMGSVEMVAVKTGMATATIYGRLSLLGLSETVQKLYNLKKLPFDLSILSLLKRMKADEQDNLVSMAVTRGWRTDSILRSGRRMLEQRGRKGHVPALKEKDKEVVVVSGKFDALAMIETKLPTKMKAAARATCKACELYKEASLAICRRCPLPEFLKRVEPGE